ncbi:MAG: iron-containing alcohol dehydrogenase [Candidatus Hodarchaeales archaeon]|jgi:alcohol dehydrogenase class IV
MLFDFLHTPDIKFGKGQFSKIGPIISQYGAKALMVVNKSALEAQSVNETLESLSDFKIKMIPMYVKGEPEIEVIDRGIRIGFEADVVIGIGGGSALDAGKAIAGLIPNGESCRDYMEVIGKGLTITKSSLPYIAVPTTAGTGCEATKNAVISSKQDGYKASIRSPYFIPKVAIIDPLLMTSVPPEVTARCGMDALTQLIEPYTSNNSLLITDNLAELGIALISESIRIAFLDGKNIEARSKMALGALLGGICLTNTGLGAVHGFASPMGAMFSIPHGSICAALLTQTVRMNIQALKERNPENQVLLKYARISELLTGQTHDSLNLAYEDLIDYLHKLSKLLDIPSLGKWPISVEDYPKIVEKAKNASSMTYNPIKLTDNELTDILKSSY